MSGDSLQFDIRRISPTEYHVNGVSITKGHWTDRVWNVQPIGSTGRPMFYDESLERVLDMVEGAMRMMAPADGGDR